MIQDEIFRRVLVAASAIVMPFGIYYRIRSQSTGERLDRRQEGLFILLSLRLAGIACMGALVAFMINPAWMAWASVNVPEWLRWAGVALGACAAALLFWTLSNLGRNLTDTVVTRQAHTLVSSGPYRYVRHPFYDAVALSLLANALTAANWFLLAAGGLVVALLVIRTPIEERHLLAHFGEPYRAYLDRTGRFLPKLSGNR